MNFFKPFRSVIVAPPKPVLLDFLSPFAAAALEEKASLGRVLDMLRTASVFLLFEEGRLVFIRRGFDRYARLCPRMGTPLGALLWHLLGSPNSMKAYDRAMRALAAHLAWYQTTKNRTDTPPEVLEIIEASGQDVSADIIYEIVADDFSGMRRSDYFEDMLRRFKFSIANPTYIRSWGTQRRAL